MSLFSYLTVVVSLWAMTLTSALPAPVRDARQAVGILKVLLSQSSGKLVAVDLDGTVRADAPDFHQKSYFDQRTGDSHVFESVLLNGSFLHFERLDINGSGNGTTNGTSVSVNPRVGVITNNQTQFQLWHEESAGGYFRYYVTIEGVNCYLAFEADGTPVEDPCSADLDLDKALFQPWVLQETS